MLGIFGKDLNQTWVGICSTRNNLENPLTDLKTKQAQRVVVRWNTSFLWSRKPDSDGWIERSLKDL